MGKGINPGSHIDSEMRQDDYYTCLVFLGATLTMLYHFRALLHLPNDSVLLRHDEL